MMADLQPHSPMGLRMSSVTPCRATPCSTVRMPGWIATQGCRRFSRVTPPAAWAGAATMASAPAMAAARPDLMLLLDTRASVSRAAGYVLHHQDHGYALAGAHIGAQQGEDAAFHFDAAVAVALDRVVQIKTAARGRAAAARGVVGRLHARPVPAPVGP